MDDRKTQLVTPRQAAEFLTVKESSLSVWRCTGRYDLPFVKIGGAVRYDLRDLEAFIEARKVR